MDKVGLNFALPCCSNSKEPETNLSVGLRITAVVIGVLATVGATLFLSNVIGLGHLRRAVGGSLLTLGVLLIIGGIVIKYRDVSKQEALNQISSSVGNLDQKQSSPEVSFGDKKFIRKDLVPNEILSQFPDICLDRLKSVPYLFCQDKNSGIPFKDLRTFDESPLFVFNTTDGWMGFVAKLALEHEPFDASSLKPENLVTIPQYDPCFIDVVVWKRRLNDDFWVLSTIEESVAKTEGSVLPPEGLLGNKHFTCGAKNADLKPLKKIEKREDLPDSVTKHLGWILDRLFNDKFFKINANMGYRNYKNPDPRFGNWRISLA